MGYKNHNYVCHTSSAKSDAVLYSGVNRFLLKLNLEIQS